MESISEVEWMLKEESRERNSFLRLGFELRSIANTLTTFAIEIEPCPGFTARSLFQNLTAA